MAGRRLTGRVKRLVEFESAGGTWGWMSLRYHASSPFEVVAHFAAPMTAGNPGTGGAGSSGALWRFARDLLRDGLHLPAGEGDVRVWPTAGGTVIELRGVEGTTRLRAPSRALAEFVHATAQLVPFGTEAQALDVDWDTAVQLLQRQQP